MTKKYSAKSQIAITINLENGTLKHIMFQQVTGGGSIYLSSSEAEQRALENHHSFGRLFKVAEVKEDRPAPVAKESEPQPIVAATPIASEPSTIVVPSLPDAKEYLADNFGISRSKLRSKVAIEAEAAKHNIVFVGI